MGAPRCNGGRHLAPVFIALLFVAALVVAGCGGQADTAGGSAGDGAGDTTEKGTGRLVVVSESGSIEPGDTRDSNHSDLLYDEYTFEAERMDRVRVEVTAEGFTPLLKLMEVSTGAHLWEWEEAYSDEDALIYTIAGPGTYEVRVYALDDATGSYEVVVTLND